MNIYIQNRIKSDPYLYRFLRENSYWYKYLNRNQNSIIDMEKIMKEKYGLTLNSKIENITKKIDMLATFLDVLK